jgi:hypothetical protein
MDGQDKGSQVPFWAAQPLMMMMMMTVLIFTFLDSSLED